MHKHLNLVNYSIIEYFYSTIEYFCDRTLAKWATLAEEAMGRHGNKGEEAAVTALKMIALKKDLL